MLKLVFLRVFCNLSALLRFSTAFALIALAACAPAPTATPPPTATLKPTAQPTATETAAPATATATNTRVPSTKTPEPTATPTEIPRPAPVIIARYGDPNDVIHFSYPANGGTPYTMQVFNDGRTFRINRGEFGVRGFTYLTLPKGKVSYDLWRDGESSGGTGEFTSGYFLPVLEARWVNQAK